MRTSTLIGRSFGVLLMRGSVIRSTERTTNEAKQHYDPCVADDSAGCVSYVNVQPYHRVQGVYIVREVHPHHKTGKRYIGAGRGATTRNRFPPDGTFGIPGTFGSDAMHLPVLNTPDLLYGLWHGSIDRDQHDFQSQHEWPWAELSRPDVWREYGVKADAAAPYWPGWYDRIPRNPAEKINSGYKA
jgi:hypothetical protein